jgi:hypothetical protein
MRTIVVGLFTAIMIGWFACAIRSGRPRPRTHPTIGGTPMPQSLDELLDELPPEDWERLTYLIDGLVTIGLGYDRETRHERLEILARRLLD